MFITIDINNNLYLQQNNIICLIIRQFHRKYYQSIVLVTIYKMDTDYRLGKKKITISS